MSVVSYSQLLPSRLVCVHDFRRALSNIGFQTDDSKVIQLRPGLLNRCIIVNLYS